MALKRIKLNDGTYVDIKDADAYVKPSTGIPASDLASGVIPDVSGKEDKSNKVTSFQNSPDDTHYPSEKLVKDSLDAKYEKPSGGIPKTDLASAVQNQLVWEKGSDASNPGAKMDGCSSSGAFAVAEGEETIAQNDAEHAEGKYNKSNKKTDGTTAQNAAGTTIHSVGIGTSGNDRKNAFEIMQNGDVYVKGVGGYDGTNAGAASTRKVQDVLPNNTEHIYVVCRACSGTYGSMSRVSTQGGVVHFKLWNPATCEEKEESYAIPANGVVEAYIPFGTVYQVWSTKSGYGASFRPVFTASNANGGTKYVHLWNLPTGVYKMGYAALYDSEDNGCRVAPLLSTDGSQDWLDDDSAITWDAGNGDIYDHEGTSAEDSGGYNNAACLGIVVSTANVSVLVQPSAKADSALAWSFQGYGRTIPGLEEYYETHGHNYEDAQYFATYDYDGNLNTFKILDFLVEAPAVEFASQNKSYTISNWYLPSAGELKTLYNNKSAYNAIQSDYSDVPALDNNWYWSSCASSPYLSWGVSMTFGSVRNRGRGDSGFVLAVSAFLFKY